MKRIYFCFNIIGGFIISLLPMCIYCIATTGVEECHVNFRDYKRTGAALIISPQNEATVYAVLLILLSIIRINDHMHFVTVVLGALSDTLNGVTLFYCWYQLIVILRVALNDTTCSKDNKKFNGISGHYYTFIFLVSFCVKRIHAVMVPLVHFNTTTFPFFSFYSSDGNDEDRPLSKKVLEFVSLRGISFTPQVLLMLHFFLGYVMTSWLTLYETIMFGYHTPQQVLLGIIVAIAAIICYCCLEMVPHHYQSFVMFIILIITTSLESIVLGKFIFSWYLLSSVISIGLSLLLYIHDRR